MAKQNYGTKEDVMRLINATKGDDAGLRPAGKKSTAKKKTAAKKKKK